MADPRNPYNLPPPAGFGHDAMLSGFGGVPGATQLPNVRDTVPTTPAPTTGAPTTYTGTQAGANPAGTGLPPEPFFESGRNAMLRYFQNKGLNPYSGAIGLTAMMNRADDIIASVLGRAVQAGQNFSDPTQAMGMVNSAFDSAMHNTPGILMGRQEAQGALGAMQKLWNDAVHSGNAPTEQQTMLSTLLSDPSKLANLATSMQFGTMGSRMQSALSQPYRDLPFWLTEYAGNRLPGAGEYDPTQTALGLLLSGGIPRINMGGQ